MPSKTRIPTVDEFFAFARSVEGELLETLHRPKLFRVSVDGSKLYITPESKEPRVTTRDRIGEVIEKLGATGSFQPSQYKHLTYNASYVLALVKAWQGHDA